MRRLHIILPGSLIAITIALIALWHFSAYIYAHALVTAVETQDLGKLARVADVERIGQGLQSALVNAVPMSLRIAGRLATQYEGGKILAGMLKGVATRTLNSPKTIAAVLRGEGIPQSEFLQANANERPLRRTMATEMRYGDTHDTFVVTFRAQQTGEEAIMIMERSGIFVWRATAITLSSPSLLLPAEAVQ